MATVKVRKVGNSLGFILPKEVVEHLYLKEGDSLQVIEEEAGIKLTPYDPSFEKWAISYEHTNRKYKNALKELAK